jgi:F-type H+-transporting ATPase subunit delta
MVTPSAVLGRYAKALADIVFEEKIEEKVTADLNTFCEIFRGVPEILETFDSPALPHEVKEKLLAELMAQYPVNAITSNFLRILLQHNRIRYFHEITESFMKAAGERKGIVSAQVTAAVPMSQQELKNLEIRLTGITGKAVNVEVQTDADLLGGMVIRIGSTIFDGTIRTQLAEMNKRLKEI